MSGRQRVAVVTGGGGGIGAAIALALGRAGDYVVTMDPLVSLDGSQTLSACEQSTADRIIAAGGSARASAVSVTDASAVAALFAELADEFGGLDAVVNVAGISRPTSYTGGTDRDWSAVLAVHLDGYRNVLSAALPLMAAAGRGHILGVTSGSGWRAADAGAYGCAKRAVAALTWQLGRLAPDGVSINALSPIAATRMVAGALEAAGRSTPVAAGGLSLAALPAPEDLGPLGVHLVSETFTACQGRVLFTAGSEIAVIDEPRLIEVVRNSDLSSGHAALDAATTIALAPAERTQASGGGSNARFGSAVQATAADGPAHCAANTYAVFADSPVMVAGITAALRDRGTSVIPVDNPAALSDIPMLDAVVIVLSSSASGPTASPEWQRVLDEHDGIATQIDSDAGWVRHVARLAVSTSRRVRLVVAHDATTSGGRTRAQAIAQLSRAARKATGELVQHFSVSIETDSPPTDLIAYLACGQHADGIAGAELVAGPGWVGLRSHPRPMGSISFGGPQVPAWFDEVLQEVVQPR